MTQAGLHIPADDTSTMPVFCDILADIGDEQSIEQSLSTFSAHMVNIVNILRDAKKGSLVLFDELGAGTDPVEGAALAVTILESVRERGSLCAATTHFAELKEFALNTEGVSNASCEFDVETLRPTYRLIIGTPGRSNAFAISTKLGLDDSIVERARTKMSGNSRRFEDVIEKLEATRIDMETQRDAAVKMRRDYEAHTAEAEQALKTKIAETERELEKQRRKAVQMLESAKVSSEFVFGQLSELKRQRESERFADELETARDKVRRTLRETDDIVNPVREKVTQNYHPPRPFAKGDDVLLVNINKTGILLDSPDGNGDVTVQAGIIKMKTNVKNLMLAEGDRVTFTDRDRKKVSATSYRTSVRADFKNELDLRGMNGEDAWAAVDKYLDEAKLVNLQSVRLIHGKGTGALRAALWKLIKGDPRIASFRMGQYGEGDLGVTVVELK
jgi:DNA mismatch repair protein MutS2